MVHTESGEPRPYYELLAEKLSLSEQPSVDASNSLLHRGIQTLPQQPAQLVRMAEDDDRIITKQGTRYFPLGLAAEYTHVSRQTLNNWITAKAEIQGQPLNAYYSTSLGQWFLAEESVNRVPNRFVFWPSENPAYGAQIGEGHYLTISQTARILRVTPQTIHNWIKLETTPQDIQLRVIKCTASGMFYVNSQDVDELKKLVPRSGLRPGRRPQQHPHQQPALT